MADTRLLPRILAAAALLAMTGCGAVSNWSRAEPDPSLKLAGVFLAAGAPEPALTAADEVLTRQPRNQAALEARAEALTRLGRTEEAQAAFAAALAADPSSIPARIALGRTLVHSDPPAAERIFLQVLARQPANAIALNNIGITRDLQGRHAEAQSAYRAARAAQPLMIGATVNLGISQVMEGDMPAAIATLTPLAAEPDAPAAVHENLGIALAASGDALGAARVLGRVMPSEEVTETLAQYRRVTPPPVASPPVASPPLPPPPTPPIATLAPAIAAPVPAVVLPTPVAVPVAVPIAAGATPAPAARSVERPVPGAGDRIAFAQLAASDNEAAARAEWERLRRRHAALLRDRREVTQTAEVAGRTVWRLRTAFPVAREAEAFCNELRAAGGQCWSGVGS
jgi:Flp pilus assembly protein TadD